MRGNRSFAMKPLLLSLAVLCGSAAVLPAQNPIRGFQSMRIEANSMPDFPATLIARGVTRGTVRIVVKVNEQGRLEDWLVIGYSEPALARTAVESLKRWKFVPARINQEPVTAQTEVIFHFRAEGVVVSQNMVEHFLSRSRAEDPPLAYEPCTLRELDRIPTPIHVVSPVYTPEMAQRGLAGDIVIEFFIDEKGQVRLPVIPGEQDAELASAVIQAVSQWTFEPPTRRGQPVLVQARQRFQFREGS
jgi:TonB family protein